MRTNKSEDKTLDNQLLSLMTHVQAFLKGSLTLGELGEAEERAEIFRTSHVTNYDKVAERVNSAQLEQDNVKMEIAIKAIFEWTKTDKNNNQSRAKAMKNLQDICSRVLNEIH